MLSHAGTIVATKKKKMIFDNHEKFCKMSIETGKAHRIPYTYRYFMCCCKKCHEGKHNDYVIKGISGPERTKWLTSNINYNELEKIMSEEN
jgi:hypothetical protein